MAYVLSDGSLSPDGLGRRLGGWTLDDYEDTDHLPLDDNDAEQGIATRFDDPIHVLRNGKKFLKDPNAYENLLIIYHSKLNRLMMKDVLAKFIEFCREQNLDSYADNLERLYSPDSIHRFWRRSDFRRTLAYCYHTNSIEGMNNDFNKKVRHQK